MRRRVFNFAAVVSLVLCVATALVSVRSRSTIDEIFYAKKDGHLWRIKSYGRVLSLQLTFPYGNDEWLWWSFPYKPGVHYDANSLTWETTDTKWWGGFVQKGSYPIFLGRTDFLIVILRYWLLALLTGLTPLVWLLAALSNVLRRSRRFRKSRCLGCCYDLTGNTSGVCPECGMAIRQTYDMISN